MARMILLLPVFVCLSLAKPLAAAESVAVVNGDAAEFHSARQPQAAVAPDGTIHVVFGCRSGIYCAASRDSGKTFAKPVEVGAPDTFALGMRRGPRVAATAKAVVVTAIGGKLGGGRDGDLLAWRSTDAGKSWAGPVRVNGVVSSAREGLHHMATAPDGTIHAVWNDSRSGRNQVCGAASADGGATWKDEKMIYESPDGGICPCCQPQVACDAKGGVHVMWRNDLSKARDMYLRSSADGGKTFGDAVKLGAGTWRIDFCPMDGGGLAADAEGRVETIWRRDKELFRARPGAKEGPLGRGEQGWAAAGADGFYLLWIEGRPGALKALLPGSERPVVLAKGAWDPVVAAPVSGKGPVVAVWEEGANKGPVRLRAAVLNAAR